MKDYNPDHYRFRRSGNLEDDPIYRRQKRRSAIIDVILFWTILIGLGLSVWWWY